MATLDFPIFHSPTEDAEVLRKAVKGWGANEKAIIIILGHRNAFQRQKIRQAYYDLYREDLVKRLESELSGDFERAMYRWILEPSDCYAVLANVAMRNGNRDYKVIVEISCVLSSEELYLVRSAYHNRYKRSLEEDVAANIAGHLRQLLVGLVCSFRYSGDETDESLAKCEADILHDALRDKKGNHEEVVRILSTRSKTQLLATFNRYRDVHSNSITKVSKEKYLEDASDDFHKAVHTAIHCINDHKKFYEKVLRNAIKKSGTDEDALTRVIVTRAEKDLKDIKDLYYKRNSIHLEHAVAKDTSGDYKNFLLTLLGKQD